LKRTVLILAMLTACSSFAFGQAQPGATRAGDLQAGGSFTYAVPDYTPQKALGYGIYAAFDFRTNWGAELDFHQISIQQHSPAKETSFEYGVRYHRTYGRYNPFVRISAGRGTFDSIPTFYQGNASPSYNLFAFAAGADAEITPRFNVRLGMDYQQWFTGGQTGPPNSGGPGTDVYLPHGLTPVIFEVGVAYHFTGASLVR
jgi:hypothetical protein